jgi:hypothetical protein
LLQFNSILQFFDTFGYNVANGKPKTRSNMGSDPLSQS